MRVSRTRGQLRLRDDLRVRGFPCQIEQPHLH